MRIAIPYENGNIFQHFGRSEAFKFYDVDGGAVTATAVVSTNGSGHGALAGFLAAHHADAVICGGIGGGAQSALTEAGIRFYGGVSGSADAAVQALLDGSLGYDPEARCDHHDHAHGAGHTCGELPQLMATQAKPENRSPRCVSATKENFSVTAPLSASFRAGSCFAF